MLEREKGTDLLDMLKANLESMIELLYLYISLINYIKVNKCLNCQVSQFFFLVMKSKTLGVLDKDGLINESLGAGDFKDLVVLHLLIFGEQIIFLL